MLNNISNSESTSGESENWLSQSQVTEYLDRIEVVPQSPNVSFLEEIISGTLAHLPFQNLSMLTNERFRPSPQKICSDMLSGLGGLCTVRNPFLYHLLMKIGFSVRFVSANMDRKNCHIALIVKIDDDDWWVDVGNGYPYQFPIKLGDESTKIHPFIKYRIVSHEDRWIVEHFRGETWETNYIFSSEGVDFSIFDEMYDLHYSKPGWGPFLTGLRVNRWWGDNFAILRDNLATSPDGQEILENPKQIEEWISKWFPKNGFLEQVNVSETFYVWKFEIGLLNDSKKQINQIHQLVGGDAERQGKWQFELMKNFGLKPEHKFLDIGCGTLRGGLFFIPYLHHSGYTGMDPNPLFIRIANRLVTELKIEFLEPTLLLSEDFYSLQGNFDFLLTQSVLNHLDSNRLVTLVNQISSLMNDKSIWVSTVHFDSSVESNQIRTSHPFRLNESLNSRFNPDWFELLLSKSGLFIDSISEIKHPNENFSIIKIRKKGGIL